MDATTTSIEHVSALGEWTSAWQRPSPALRGLVGGYTGYRVRLSVPATHRGVPSATLPLVINLGPQMTIALPGSGRPPATVGSFLAGIHDRYVLIDAQEHHGIQVDLEPAGARRLLGHPLAPLTAEVVGLDEVFGRDAERLVDDIASLPDWPSRFRCLDGALSRKLLEGPQQPDAEVEQAWQLIRASRGQVRVAELARETGWSQRRLSARFGRELGLSPKRMARLTRLEHVMELLAGPERTHDLATVAVLAGFYDQAHLTNEVRDFTGLSPTRLVASYLRDGGGSFDLDAA